MLANHEAKVESKRHFVVRTAVPALLSARKFVARPFDLMLQCHTINSQSEHASLRLDKPPAIPRDLTIERCLMSLLFTLTLHNIRTERMRY